jgi:hypothetical protein
VGKLSRAAVDALRTLSDGVPHPTTTSTTGRYIGGMTAKALIARGLARRWTFGEVRITAEGHAALAKIDFRIAPTGGARRG